METIFLEQQSRTVCMYKVLQKCYSNITLYWCGVEKQHGGWSI